MTRVQKCFFVYTPCSSKRCSLPRLGSHVKLPRMCVRWEKELPSFGASLGVIMAQGGLAHDQSVCPVASCPGHGQLSLDAKGFSEKIRSSSECCCTSPSLAVTRYQLCAQGLHASPRLEGLKTVSVVVQVLTVRAATHPQPVLRGDMCALFMWLIDVFY